MVFKNLDDLLKRNIKRQRLVAVAAEDLHLLSAVKKAYQENIITPILIGNKKKIIEICYNIDFNVNSVDIIDTPQNECAEKAIELIKKNEGDILMKGLISTSQLLKSIVKKETGISGDALLSHFAISQVPAYHKLLAYSDAAMNIQPDIKEKAEIIRNSVRIMRKLGYNNPKVAIVCPVENVNPKIESTVHAGLLKVMNKNNEIEDCIIDGPLALDNAISIESAKHKNINSEVAGDADLLITHDLNSGNILYKAINFLAGGSTAAIITGAQVPIVLTSRSDSEINKFYSIVLAAAL
jgi:phosphate butyryltransferase